MSNRQVGGLPILEKTYELILWLYPTVNKFPKSQRFVLGQRIENTILKIIESIIGIRVAINSEEKLWQLKKISVEIDKMRILIRLSKDLGFIKTSQYVFASEKINEMGRMLGGWMKIYQKGNC
jgi:hypothetical protein